MSVYEEIIPGPDFVVVSFPLHGKYYEVEAYVTKHATGMRYYEWDTGASGWQVMTYPTFAFEGFDDDDMALVFDTNELKKLEDDANQAYWDKVGEYA